MAPETPPIDPDTPTTGALTPDIGSDTPPIDPDAPPPIDQPYGFGNFVEDAGKFLWTVGEKGWEFVTVNVPVYWTKMKPYLGKAWSFSKRMAKRTAEFAEGAWDAIFGEDPPKCPDSRIYKKYIEDLKPNCDFVNYFNSIYIYYDRGAKGVERNREILSVALAKAHEAVAVRAKEIEERKKLADKAAQEVHTFGARETGRYATKKVKIDGRWELVTEYRGKLQKAQADEKKYKKELCPDPPIFVLDPLLLKELGTVLDLASVSFKTPVSELIPKIIEKDEKLMELYDTYDLERERAKFWKEKAEEGEVTIDDLQK